MAISSDESEAIIDIGWPSPQNFTISKQHNNVQMIVTLDWDSISIEDPIFSTDNGYGFNSVYYRVMVNEKTYLATDSHIVIPLLLGGRTCMKVKAIYEIGDDSPYYIQSDWTKEICIENPTDLYCKKRCNSTNVAKTQNNISRKQRYALAIKTARGASNFIC